MTDWYSDLPPSIQQLMDGTKLHFFIFSNLFLIDFSKGESLLFCAIVNKNMLEF